MVGPAIPTRNASRPAGRERLDRFGVRPTRCDPLARVGQDWIDSVEHSRKEPNDASFREEEGRQGRQGLLVLRS